MNGARDQALSRAAWKLQGILLEVVRKVHGDDAVERRARYEGDQFPDLAPKPLPGLQAAEHLARRAGSEVTAYALLARAAGHSWDEIGRALGMDPSNGRSVAEAAYERFADSPASWAFAVPSLTWRCPACGRVISDRGPYEDHPDDNQPGHADGCTRLKDEIDRWRSARYDAEEEETDA